MFFQVYRDDDRLWRWNLRTANNDIIASSLPYVSKRSMMRAIAKLAAQMIDLEEIPVIERLR